MLINISSGFFHNLEKKILANFFSHLQLCTHLSSYDSDLRPFCSRLQLCTRLPSSYDSDLGPFCSRQMAIFFKGHPSNCKVTWLKKLSIFTQISCFQTVTPVWIHQLLRNDAKSLKEHRRGALLFFGGIYQISRSHGLKKNLPDLPCSEENKNIF